MSKLRAIQISALALFGAASAFGQAELLQQVQEVAESVEIESLETTYDQALGVARASGEVRIEYGGATIYANEAEYHQNTGDIYAKDDVTIYKGGQVFNGEEAVYNINTGVIVASGLSSGLDPLYYRTANVTLPSDDVDVIRTEDTYITTHDNESPNWKIKAKKINIYPDDYIVFRGATLYMGKLPVGYLPYFAQPLDDELGYFFTPGYSDAWGPYILNQYGFLVGDHTLATAHLDYRVERGIAGGIELESIRHKKNDNFGRIFYYHAQDSDPNLDTGGNFRNVPIDSERYRLNVQHRVYLPGPEKSSLYLDVDANILSDQFFYLDFFPGEVRDDPQPDNLINLVKNHPLGTVSLLGRFQLNDFFRTDTRLPEIAIDGTRTPIFGDKLFFEGNTSYSILEERLGQPEEEDFRNRLRIGRDRLRRVEEREQAIADGVEGAADRPPFAFDPVEEADIISRLERQLDENQFNRFHTYQQIGAPLQLGGWLNIVPRGGIGYSNYSDVSGNLTTVNSADRLFGHAGVDASFKLSKVYPNVQSRALGLDEVRHIFQPYSRFSYVAADSLNDDFPQIDRLALSTKLRPLDITRYTATDAIDDWNIVRVGAFNRLQTKRNGATYPWLELNSYVDLFVEDPEFDRDYSNLFNELRWLPLPWLALVVDSQLPLGDEFDFTEINSYASFQPWRNFQFSLGHFYLQDHPFFNDSSQMRFSTYSRLNDNWGFSTFHFYEFETSTLQLQQYMVHRDLSSWTAAFGAQIRDNGVQEELGVVFSMTLKAFPRVGMPVDFYGGNR